MREPVEKGNRNSTGPRGEDLQIKIRLKRDYARTVLPQLMSVTGTQSLVELFRLSIRLLRVVVEYLTEEPGRRLAVVNAQNKPVVILDLGLVEGFPRVYPEGKKEKKEVSSDDPASSRVDGMSIGSPRVASIGG